MLFTGMNFATNTFVSSYPFPLRFQLSKNIAESTVRNPSLRLSVSVFVFPLSYAEIFTSAHCFEA
jgi:hypothetical protein